MGGPKFDQFGRGDRLCGTLGMYVLYGLYTELQSGNSSAGISGLAVGKNHQFFAAGVMNIAGDIRNAVTQIITLST